MKKIISIMCMICSTVSFLIATLSIIFPIYRNAMLEKSFASREDAYPYEDVVNSGNISLEELSKLLTNIVAPIASPDKVHVVKAPDTIHYYRNIGDDIPAYTIEKGASIYVKVSQILDYAALGINSVPSETKGWRLARPFAGASGIVTEHEIFYVKLSDLEKVAQEYLRVNPSEQESVRRAITKEPPMTWLSEERFVTVTFDYATLYKRGIYLSPDLYSPIFSTIIYISLGVGSATARLAFWLRKRNRTNVI